jgi:uncharacterized protein YegL
MAEQRTFLLPDLAPNPEPRCPCVLVVDVSGSMAGQRIHELNQGLDVYKSEVEKDSLASQRIEIAVMTFADQVNVVCPFTTVDRFAAPTLVAGSMTNMGAAILRAIDLVEQRKKFYKDEGLHYWRPWIWLITDGEPTDEWRLAAASVKDGETAKKFAFFAIGVADANMKVLKDLSIRQPLRLQGLQFRQMFQWLSQSQRSVSQSQPGQEERVQLANPTAPNGWASL